jgi:hypothetical protein
VRRAMTSTTTQLEQELKQDWATYGKLQDGQIYEELSGE